MTMRTILSTALTMLLAAGVWGCGGDDDDGGGGGGGHADTDAGSDSDTDAGTGADTDADTDASTGTDADTDSGTDSGSDTGADADCEWSFSVAQASDVPLRDIGGYGDDNIVVVGDTTFHYDGSSWTEISLPGAANLNGVWLPFSTSAVAVGDAGVTFTFDGTSWSAETANTCDSDLLAVWAPSLDERYAAAGYTMEGYPQGTVYEWQYGSWDNWMGTAKFFRGIWGASSDEITVVGDGGLIHVWDGSDWNLETPTFTDVALHGVHGSSASNVWVVGEMGTVFHFGGGSWAEVSVGSSVTLLDVWCASSTSVFAGGNDGTLLVYDGEAWESVETGYDEPLSGVYAPSATHVYCVTENGSDSKIIEGVCD